MNVKFLETIENMLSYLHSYLIAGTSVSVQDIWLSYATGVKVGVTESVPCEPAVEVPNPRKMDGRGLHKTKGCGTEKRGSGKGS